MKLEEAAKATQAMQEYIERHLKEPLTLRRIADAAGYSPWYAERLFREAAGMSPFEYVRARRLTRAALVLRDEQPKVIDVALDFLFDSHEGFTRAFSKQFGLPPRAYSRGTPPIPLFLPEKAHDRYRANHLQGGNRMNESRTKSIFVQVIERPARKVLLKRGVAAADYFAYCEEVGCDVWGMLMSVKEALYEPVGMWLPDHLRKPGTSVYVQGVELPLDYAKPVPDGFELLELPPCKMMIFQGEPYDDEAFQDAIGEVWEHIGRFRPEVYGYRWAPEEAPRFQLAPMGYRGYIEARPVKDIQD